MESLAGLSAQELIKRKDDIEEEIKTQLLILDGVSRGMIAYSALAYFQNAAKERWNGRVTYRCRGLPAIRY